MLAKDEFYDYINEKVAYLDDITEKAADEICENYFDGTAGMHLYISQITDNTPCGNYYVKIKQHWKNKKMMVQSQP
jgi:hypothetical protein